MGIRHELRFPVGTVTLVIGMSIAGYVFEKAGKICNWSALLQLDLYFVSNYKWISVIPTYLHMLLVFDFYSSKYC